jgi:hypothetical protein
MENYEHIETPGELTKDIRFQETSRDIIKSEIVQLERILQASDDPSVDLNILKAQYAHFMNLPKQQFDEELLKPSGYIDFMEVKSKEDLIFLMKNDLDHLRAEDEKLTALQN